MDGLGKTLGFALLTFGITGCGDSRRTAPFPIPTAPAAPTQAASGPTGFIGPYFAELTLSGVVYETRFDMHLVRRQ